MRDGEAALKPAESGLDSSSLPSDGTQSVSSLDDRGNLDLAGSFNCDAECDGGGSRKDEVDSGVVISMMGT